MSLKKLMNVLKPATASAITCKKNFASPALLNNSIFTSYCYITLYSTVQLECQKNVQQNRGNFAKFRKYQKRRLQ